MRNPFRAAVRRLAVMAALFALVAPLPSVAGPLSLERLVAQIDADETCWIRLYDDAHLAAHPEQTVAGIMLVLSLERFGLGTDVEKFSFGLEVLRRGQTSTSGGSGFCTETRSEVRCDLRCDAGAFYLRPGQTRAEIVVELGPEDSLRLQSGWDCGVPEDQIDVLTPGRGDQSFVLRSTSVLTCANSLVR